MARKSSYPPLYELMGERPRGEAPAPKPQPPSGAERRRWLSPGRTIRLPIGYLLMAGTAVAAFLIVAFSAGYHRGQREARTDSERDWLARATVLPPEQPPEKTAPKEQATRTVGPDREAGGPSVRGDAPAGWGPVFSDPRQPGHNYFVLIHTHRESARRLAEFCRGLGVEAYVIKAKNVSLHRVIAFPGYRKGERSSEAVRELERRIVEIARKWKLQVNARDDLAYYPERFDG